MSEQEIFLAAVEISDPQARQAYLDQACAGNPGLRQQVEALLNVHAAVGDFLATPAIQQLSAKPTAGGRGDGAQASGSMDDEKTHGYAQDSQVVDNDEVSLGFLSPSTNPGSLGRLGHYEVHEVLGHGAFGIVLRAFDEKLHRMVAIKVMSPELASTSPPRKRFLREARASAAIRHDNVVAVYAVEEQPIPYLVMEYIPGLTLDRALKENGPLDVADVLRIGQQIALGLAAAHAQGLIHRDIKPANILLENGLTGRVKISDFGLARAADDASLTTSGTIAGTPLYMSPEQATSGKIDQRSDLFSFGSVLYVIVSGRPPFRAGNSLAVLKRVVEDTPRAIPEIIADVPSWLCAIIAKLQAKQPDERFATAREVAELLGQCLADVHANRPVQLPSDIYPADLLKGSHPLAAAAGQKPFPLKERAERIEENSKQSRRFIARQLRSPTIAAIVVLLLAGLGITEATGVTKLTSTVIRLTTSTGTLVIEADDPEVKVTIDGEEVHIQGAGVEQLSLKPGEHQVASFKDGTPVSVRQVTITRGGREVVRVTMEGNVDDGQPLNPSSPVNKDDRARTTPAQEFPDLRGQPFAARTAATWKPGPAENAIPGLIPRPAKLPGILRWQIESIVPRASTEPPVVSPDGQYVATRTVRGNAVRLYRTETQELVCLFPQPDGVTSISWHKGSRQFATGCVDGRVRLWNIDGSRGPEWQAHPDHAEVFWSPDGEWLATKPSSTRIAVDPVVRLWKPDGTAGPVVSAKGLTNVNCLSWSRDGKSLAAVIDWRLCFWHKDRDAAQPLELGTFQVVTLDWHPDGSRMALGGYPDREQEFLIRLMTSHGETLKEIHFPREGGVMNQIAWSPDGSVFAAAMNNAYGFWNADATPVSALAQTGGKVKNNRGVYRILWSPDGQTALMPGNAQGDFLKCKLDGTRIESLPPRPYYVDSCFWSADSRRIGVIERYRGMFWDEGSDPTKPGPEAMEVPVGGGGDQIAWHPDMPAFVGGPAFRWWTLDGRPHPVFDERRGKNPCWSPDGRTLVEGSALRYFDTSGRLVDLHTKGPSSTQLAWNTDSTRLVLNNGSQPNSAAIISRERADVIDLVGHTNAIVGVAWSPNGRWIATAGGDSTVRLWKPDGTAGPVTNASSQVFDVIWAPDSQRLAYALNDGTVRIQTVDGVQGLTLRPGAGYRVVWDPTGKLIAGDSRLDARFDFVVSNAEDGTVVWSARAHHPSSVTGLDWSHDGKWLVTSGQEDSTHYVWNARTREEQWLINTISSVEQFSFDAAGQLLHGNPARLDTWYRVFVEGADGKLSAMKPSEFVSRFPELITPGSWPEPGKPDDPERKEAQWLFAAGCQLRVTVAGIEHVISNAAELPTVRFTLVGIYGPLTSGDLVQVTPEKFPNLYRLDLTNEALNEFGMKALKRLTSLTHLALITSKGVGPLLPGLPQLRRLQLGGDGTNDELLQLDALPNLLELNLGNMASITDAALESLQKLKRLRQLNLVGTKITPDGAARLKAVLPECDVQGP